MPLVRDIAETASSIVLSGKGAPGFGEVHGFFAGVPLRIGRLAVGAFCVVDEQPRELSADDFEVLQAFGRRASSVLTGDDIDSAAADVGAVGGAVGGGVRRHLVGADAPLSRQRPRAPRGGDRLRRLAGAVAGGALTRRSAKTTWRSPTSAAGATPPSRPARAAPRRRRCDGRSPTWAEHADARVGLVTVDSARSRRSRSRRVRRLPEAALARALARRDDGEERVERFTVGRAAPMRQKGTTGS